MCISTGNMFGDLAIGIGLGALTGGLAAPAVGGSLFSGLAGVGASAVTSVGGAVTTAGQLAAIGGGIVGGVASGFLGATSTGQQLALEQQMEEPEKTVTGSGGKQAGLVLASEIKRAAREGRSSPSARTRTPGFGPGGTGLQLSRA